MNIAPIAGRLASEGVAFAPQIASAAVQNGVDPNLLAAVAAQETGGPGSNAGRNIVGDGGHGRGLFQIDDRSHRFANTSAAMNPGQNANYAAGMLHGLLGHYGGNVKEALSAYNSGDPHASGTATTWSDGQRLGYADSVMRHYQSLTGQPASNLSSGTEASASANSALTEQCVAESASTSSLVNALQGLMQQSGAPAIPTPPQNTSWQQTEGLDATGHPRDSQSEQSDQGDDD